MVQVQGFLTPKGLYRQSIFKKFKYEDIIKIKNKPDPALFIFQIYPEKYLYFLYCINLEPMGLQEFFTIKLYNIYTFKQRNKIGHRLNL
jgi:hypothetical protein